MKTNIRAENFPSDPDTKITQIEKNTKQNEGRTLFITAMLILPLTALAAVSSFGLIMWISQSI